MYILRHSSRSSRNTLFSHSARISLLLIITAFVSLLPTPSFAAGISSIESSITSFTNIPKRLFYLDNSEVIFILESSTNLVWRSPDEGKTWNKITVLDGVATIVPHPHFNDVVIALTSTKKHWISTDQGKSWKEFTTPGSLAFSSQKQVVAFHASRPTDFILLLENCESHSLGMRICFNEAYYSKDSFATLHKLMTYVDECIWARSTKHFDSTPTDSIFCLEYSNKSGDQRFKSTSELRLVTTEDFFKDESTRSIVYLGGGAPLGFGIVEEFLVIAVKSKASHQIEMWVSMDGLVFAPAQFPDNNSKREAYTILESSQYSLTIDIATKSKNGLTLAPFGSLYYSNSNGTYFSKSLDHTNRNMDGHVDFERIQSPIYEGIMFANVVVNWEEVELLPSIIADELKDIITKVSFDNGHRWRLLTPPEKDSEGKAFCSRVSTSCALHLNSVTRPHNLGRVFSSAGAPGFVLGVGNVGSKLGTYEKGDTFLSTDGGLTWTCVAKGPHKYETLDQGSLIVLIPDYEKTDHVLVSNNHGKTFEKYKPSLSGISQWKVRLTDIDASSTSRKMIAWITDTSDKNYLMQLNFEKYYSSQCGTSDFELWKPKYKSDGPECLMGHETGYTRRKADSQCYVGKKFEDPKVTIKPCSCTEEDFECDFNYVRNDGKCEVAGYVNDQPSDCPAGTKYQGKSGYRKIPGNKCEGGVDLEKHVEKTCKGEGEIPTIPSTPDNHGGKIVQPPGNRHPIAKLKTFNSHVDKVWYINTTSIIFLRTESGEVYRSPDEGATWTQPEIIKSKGPVLRIGVHETLPKRVFFIFKNEDQIWISEDALEGYVEGKTPSDKTFRLLKTPAKYNLLNAPIIDFHPEEPEWLVFVSGGRSCPDVKDCFTQTWLSVNNGHDWTSAIDSWSVKCLWGRDSKFLNKVPKDSVICLSYKFKNGKVGQDVLGGKPRSDNPLQLVMYTNRGRTKKVLIEQGVLNFFVIDHVMVAAVEISNDLKLMVTLDGSKFTEAVFPPNIKVEKSAFTMLQSTTGGIFMDVGQNDNFGSEYGTLFVSNEEGIYFSRSLQNTNRDARGYVDFDKLQGIEGIAIANQVTNVADLGSGRGSAGAKKKVRTLISFDDGSTWKRIPAPAVDVFGKKIECTGDCGLNLYSHTNIHPSLSTTGLQTSALHSTAEAIGLMVAVGNVGTELTAYNEGNMYLTRDAGHTWTEIHKDAHKFAFGDHGTLIVLVNDEGPTDTVVYSWDFGTSWAEYQISEKPIRVSSLISIPSSTKFVIIGSYVTTSSLDLTNSKSSGRINSREESMIIEPRDFTTTAESSQTVVLHLDFSSLLPNKCNLDESNPARSDFEKWSPRGTTGERCFLGREIEYLRRKRDRLCFVSMEWKQLPQKEEVCACSESDFLCDTHFWRNDQGKCVLYGLDPKQPKNCKFGDSFTGSSGYRKIGLSKCKSGVNLEKEAPQRICGEQSSGGGPGSVAITFQEFNDKLVDYHYFNNSNTVIFTDNGGTAWISHNNGRKWAKALSSDMMDKVTTLIPDTFREERAYLITLGKTIWYTENKGETWKKITAPTLPNHFMIPVLSVHPTKDWLLWVGDTGCTDDSKGDCRTQVYYSGNKGGNWKLLREYVVGCIWGRDAKFVLTQEESVFCMDFKEKKGDMPSLLRGRGNNPIIFEKTSNWGSSWTTIDERTVGFAIVEEYMVYALMNAERTELVMKVSLNGNEWAEARWPPNFRVPDYGYTVLQSTTGRLVIDVNTKVQQLKGQDVPLWGSLFRSNFNGTNFTISIDHTNRDTKGYVDFEKMQSIEGIALVNQIQNPDEVIQQSAKKIRTKITFNDGNTWVNLVPPSSDLNGERYSCTNDCFLNLHAYTERMDKRDQYSSSSAPGIMVGVGNVGPYLTDYNSGDMFVTKDAGLSWTEIAKDAHMYEFGDHGGILIMVNNEGPTDTIKYSLNEGKTFTDIKVTEYTGGHRIRVTNIITEPAGSTSFFTVFGIIKSDVSASKTIAITLDFTESFATNCVYNANDASASDFEAFRPGLTNDNGNGEEGCLFGRKVTYFVRKSDRECRIKQEFKPPMEIAEPCKCTRADYECDYNYYYDSKSGKCLLYTGLNKPAPYCHADGTKRETTGYVKVHSSCVGGEVLDEGTIVGSCSGGMSAWGWIASVLATGGIVWFVSSGFQSYKRTGRIRLPTDELDFTGNSSNSFTEKATMYLHAAALFLLEVAEVAADQIKKGYDYIVPRGGRGRGGFMSSGNDGYVPVFADEAIDAIEEGEGESGDELAFNPTDPNDASLLALDENDY